MTIVSVHEMWSKQTSDATLNDSLRVLTFTTVRAFQVVHSADATIFEILAADDGTTSIPVQGEPFPGTDYCIAKGANTTKVSPIMTIVTINYEGTAGADLTDSPLNKPTEIDWGDTSADEEIDQDIDGNPIVNTVGERIRGIKAEIADDVLTLKKNFLTFNPYVRGQYRRSVNSDTFFGWPPGTGRVKQFSARNVISPDIGYWEVTLRVQFRYPYNTTPEKAWYARTLNMGYNVRPSEGVTTGFVRAVDTRKEPVTKPVLLKEDGTRETDETNALWLEFKRYQSLPFNALGF